MIKFKSKAAILTFLFAFHCNKLQTGSIFSSLFKTQPSTRFQDLPLDSRRSIFEFAGRNQCLNQLQSATFNHNLEDVRSLLKFGMHPDTTIPQACTALCIAASASDYVNTPQKMRKSLIILNTLLRYGADANKPGNDGNTPLHCAVEKHNIPALQALIIHERTNLNFKNRWFRLCQK